MVLQQSVAATAAAPSTHHVHHYGHHHHHHGRQNLNIQSNGAASQEPSFTTANRPAQPLATVLNLHHSRSSPHRRASFRSCSSLYNHRNPALSPPARQSYYQLQQEQEAPTDPDNRSPQSEGLNANPSAMHDHHHSGHNVHHNHHRRNSNHNGANQNLVNHGPLTGHTHHLNSSSSHYNNSQRQTNIADDYSDVVRKVCVHYFLF